ncbi:MAG: methylmalonyl-CoA mutase family protein [Phocaeicola sp.]
MADSKEKLFSDFPAVSTETWMQKITADLKGADFEKKLVWKTNEGFKVKPFYRQEDIAGLKTTDAVPGEFPYLRSTKKADNNWYVRQNIEVISAKEANTKALDILNRGVDSIGFNINANDLSVAFIAELLAGICPEAIELNFSTCQGKTVELADLLVRYYVSKDYELRNLKGSINYDPMARMMVKGKDLSDFSDTAAELIATLSPLPQYRCINVNALALNNAGSYIAQELGYALAWGNEYLSELSAIKGLDVATVAKRIKFNFGISANYFLEIAKFRAARMLWANIVKQYEPKCTRPDCTNKTAEGLCQCACKMAIHAETSSFNLTLFDAQVNMLRTQTEAMSAALGGVDSMTVTPFDSIYQAGDEFSERIARNQQLLLKEESHLGKVVDPAAGSYYIESLTVAIAEQAWALFLQVEEEGGMLAAIQAGKVQAAINASNSDRQKAVSQRREILLGTNQYPNFTEVAGEKRSVTSSCCCSAEAVETPIAMLNFQRASSQFEALRLKTEASGKTPKAFMLTIGNLAMRQARAQFACNFLGCAGYQVVDNLGFATVEEGAAAAKVAGADIVVLCSSDDEYAELAIPAFQAVGSDALFIVAGAPACAEELKAAGIENFINVRCNVLDTLKEYNAKLGIK